MLLLSETDPLTGLLNRRGVENHISEFENHYKFTEKYICVLLISIDNFRGRSTLLKTGDEIIVRISECIRACTRKSSDLFARMGGEEFLIISDIKSEGAISLALRVKRAVTDLQLQLSEKQPPLTVSIGVAQRDGGSVFNKSANPI
jgi:diguanylate cyclase (GGDEF)-like protein